LVGIPLEERRKKKKKKKIMMMMTITIPSPCALSIGVDRGNPLKACSVSFINCISWYPLKKESSSYYMYTCSYIYLLLVGITRMDAPDTATGVSGIGDMTLNYASVTGCIAARARSSTGGIGGRKRNKRKSPPI
jgi:hypothetical protein